MLVSLDRSIVDDSQNIGLNRFTTLRVTIELGQGVFSLILSN
jgi:hypothetical protein